MSHFYGILNGTRGEATRCGSKGSGLATTAASWDGAIRVYLSHDEKTGKNNFYVGQQRWHGRGVEEVIAEGVIGERVTTATGSLVVEQQASIDALHNGVTDLLSGADDTGCSGDSIVVSKAALRKLAELTCDSVPAWLCNGDPSEPGHPDNPRSDYSADREKF